MYQATGGSRWTNNSKWASSSPVCGSGYQTGSTALAAALTAAELLGIQIPLIDQTFAPWRGIECVGNNVTAIRLFDSQLSGTIPSSLVGLSTLRALTLAGNEPKKINAGLSGSIPSALTGLTSLEELEIKFTRVSGRIPSTVYQLSKLQQLDLQADSLSGTIEALGT